MFWIDNPSILVTQWYSIFPHSKMSLSEKTNTLTRLAVIVSAAILLLEPSRVNQRYITIVALSVFLLTLLSEKRKRQAMIRESRTQRSSPGLKTTPEGLTALQLPPKGEIILDPPVMTEASRLTGVPYDDAYEWATIRPAFDDGGDISWLAGCPSDGIGESCVGNNKLSYYSPIKRQEVEAPPF